MIEAGFTGTERGMTDAQKRSLEDLLIRRGVQRLHHGDCIGADEQAHEIAVSLGIRPVIHPPSDPKFRAFCKTHPNNIRPEKPYMERNDDIVAESKEIYAAPQQTVEVLRDGTWATIRRARKAERKLFIIWRDGTVEEER